ncbi:MAG TPA: hypothetical protein VGK90_10900 [Rhizomicrobium sp.]|jgi:hypothetical protein
MNVSKPLIALAALVSCICRPVAAADISEKLGGPLASLPFTTEPDGLVDVTAGIVGHSVNLRLDTGGILSMLTETNVDAMGLPRDSVGHSEWISYAGTHVTEYARVGSVRLDRYDASAAKFIIVTDNGLPMDVAGQLGADFLSKYDVEFDSSREIVNIHTPGQCANIWPASTAHEELPMDVTGNGQVTVEVQLDGKPAKALLDTGLGASILSLAAGKDMFGFTTTTPGLKALASHNGAAYLLSYPFKTLAFNGTVIANPSIEIQTNVKQWPDLIIGANILRRMHFCIGYDSRKFYVAAADTH